MPLTKIFLLFLCWAAFAFVILKVPYPENLSQASFGQLILFFIPLYFALLFTLNILLKGILISLSISLGLIFFLALRALDSLNLVTGALTLFSIYLLVSYFRKSSRSSLTSLSKIPKLTGLRRNK